MQGAEGREEEEVEEGEEKEGREDEEGRGVSARKGTIFSPHHLPEAIRTRNGLFYIQFPVQDVTSPCFENHLQKTQIRSLL